MIINCDDKVPIHRQPMSCLLKGLGPDREPRHGRKLLRRLKQGALHHHFSFLFCQLCQGGPGRVSCQIHEKAHRKEGAEKNGCLERSGQENPANQQE